MVKFIKGYFEEGKRINEGKVNNKNYKVYLNTNTGDTIDMIGNLDIKGI